MSTYEVGQYIPSLREPQHKTYLGNTSVYTGYLDQAAMVGAATGTTGDTVVIPLITLPHGSLINKWEIKFTAFGTSAVAQIGFRYVNLPSAVANVRYGHTGYGFPTENNALFSTNLDVSAAGTTSDVLYTPFLCQADVQIVVTISGQTGAIVPSASKIALLMTGRAKGAL